MGSKRIDRDMVVFWLPFLLSLVTGIALSVSDRIGLGVAVYLAGNGVSMLAAAAFCGR